eukprot:Phypoly_transcript_03573.p1 GENE.Phypoly_transcript_03573~~Phypoly_transcript_03573.p1  ORF type:complete len:698 (+),score=80.79 Phypoly_transcript_03573:268-2361(+)
MVTALAAPEGDEGTAKCRVGVLLFQSLKMNVGGWLKVASPTEYCLCKAWPQNHSNQDFVLLDETIASSERSIINSEVKVTPIRQYTVAESVRGRLVANKKSDLTTAQQSQILADMNGLVCATGCFITSGKFKIHVCEIQPTDTFVLITPSTNIFIEDPIIERKQTSSYINEDILIGGLENVIHSLHEMLIYPLEYPKDFQALNIDPPTGVLLYGPPGCGKTLVVRKVAHDSRLPLVYIDAPQIIGAYVGESESNIRREFANAAELASIHGACIVFIDEIDALQESRGVIGQLLTLLDGIKKREKVIVIAATNRPHTLDPAMRRPGRLDREIEVNVPNLACRLKILSVHCSKLPLHPDTNFQEIAERTAGYVGADLAAVSREAAMCALRRATSGQSNSRVMQQDFLDALKILPPSTLKGSIVDDIPKTTWQDIGGLEGVKQQLIAAVEWPLLHRETYTKLGLHPPRGLLLHGPPGCAKTTLVKAVANSCKAAFLTLPAATIFSPYLGDAERTVRDAFRMARRARPAIIFFDEIDAIAAKRELGSTEGHGGEGVQSRVLSTMLNEMDGIEQVEGILVIGATNRLDMIDPALIRPGRFDKVLSVPPPDMASRHQILQIHTKHMPIAPDVDLLHFAQITNIFTGAEIENMCREAAFIALRENFDASIVTRAHFLQAYEIVQRSVKRHPQNSNSKFEFIAKT